MPKVIREWHGPEIQMRTHRAAGRGIISIGTHIAVATKQITHVITGNLRRSIHVAPAFYEKANEDIDRTLAGEDLLLMGAEEVEAVHSEVLGGPAIEVGSWLPYACVEWVGRGHPGITQGMEAVRGPVSYAIMKRAFREEGLV